jgi:hypothetical protein
VVLFEPEAPRPPGDGRLGAAVAAGVDLDGDGLPDLMGGAPYLGGGAVEIRAEPGPPPAKPPLLLQGLGPAEQFGASVANVGDLDGDGWNDLAVGAPNAVSDGRHLGRVYLFRGGPAADRSPYRILEGARDGEWFGASVANAGDVDGDGADDLVVGAPGNGIPGCAYVFLGGRSFDDLADVTVSGGNAGAFGSVVSAAGDVNGDGLGDLLVSGPPLASRPAGTVHLFYGHAGPGAWTRVSFEGGRVGDGFGAALCAAGDLDGDGFGDFAVGAPLADGPGPEAGAVFVYFGNSRFLPVPGMVIHGAAARQYLGSALAGGFDLDADQLPDLLIGSPGDATAGPDAGRLDVLFGGGDDALDRSVFGVPGARLGSALAGRTVLADSVFAVVAAGAPLDGKGRVTGLVAARWRFTAPAEPAGWIAGSRQQVSWNGATPADLVFAGADGSVTPLAATVGGGESNALEVAFPATLPDSGRLELRPAGPGPPGRASSGRVTFRHVVRVVRFEWEPRDDGVALHWATEPPLGPGGIAGFRLFREPRGDGPRTQLGGSAFADTAYLDANGRAGDRYTLTALTELGAEFEAGGVAIPEAPTQLRVWPQPAGESGEVRIEFAAPGRNGEIAGDLEVQVFDARGRFVTTLARGKPPTRAGVVRLQWDGRNHRNERAGPGIYFLRVRAPSVGFERTRRIVLLDSR